MTADPGLEDSLFGVILQDSYKITGLLGQGGMGAVYDAIQIRLNKRVAIKVMARELASNPEALNRFHREAMITSGLGHPHIVQVFDFATMPTGQPFLAMEFLDGEDLDRRLARVGRFSPEQTARIVKQTAAALSATHAQQIVHRDLKPANIYLLRVAGEDDFVKVLDFGISKILVANNKITKASALIGTPDYMSPEQAMGGSDDVDHRTDQWALACIAWECLSGKGPFAADTIPAMLFQVVHGNPAPLASRVEGLPETIEPVLRKALSKNKEDRFANVVEFAQALEAAVWGGTTEQAAVQAVMQAQSSRRVAVQLASEVSPETATYESAPEEPSQAPDNERNEDRTERPTTTFSHTAGETKDGSSTISAAPPKWKWAAVGGGAVALALILFLALRPGGQAKQPAGQATSAPPAHVPAPTPTQTAGAGAAAPAVAAQPGTGEPTQPRRGAATPPGVQPASAPAAVAPTAEAGAAAASAPAAATDGETKSRAKKPFPATRAKAKAPTAERRLIKEL
jgi:serine/threonine-protein kinase